MKLYTARPITDEAIPVLWIRAADPIPETASSEEHLDMICGQAEEVYRRLTASLPQGVIDHLFIMLAARAASVLVIRDPLYQKYDREIGKRQ